MIEVRRSKLGVDAAGLTDIAKRIETATHRLMQRARQASAAVR
jgi:hypothetical protein